jgi:hypothetical protein
MFPIPIFDMITLKWIARMFLDLLRFGIANQSMGMSLAVISLLVLGAVAVAVKITAPFIYTLF